MALSDLPQDASANPDSLRLLDDIYVPYPAHNDPCLKIACRAVFFFDGGGTREKRIEGFRILSDYAKRYRTHLSHMQHATKGKAKIIPIDWTTFDTEGEKIIADLPSEKECEVGLFGPPFSLEEGGIALFGGSLFATKPDQLRTTDISYLEFSVSHSSLVDNGFDIYVDAILDACKRLKPLYGLAGPSIQFDRIYSTTTAHVLSFPLLKRFPGLHCGRDLEFTIRIQGTGNKRIFTTNWLTIVSDTVLAQSPEASAALTDLPPTCPIHKYKGGVLIQAGDYPQLGDVNRGLVLDDYRRVAQALKPVRFEDYPLGLLDVEEPLDSLEESLKWIRRFD